jgi:sodium/hydrogen exchanger-like protein 6/7
VFSYLGLTFFSYNTQPWSFDLITLMFIVIVVGRAISTIGLYSLLRLCGYESKSLNPLSFKELIFIWYAGLIRGAVAFGLVLRISPADSANRDVIVTASLSLVVLTTVVFGSTVGLVGNLLFEQSEAAAEVGDHYSQEEESQDELHPNLENLDALSNKDSDKMAMVRKKGCVAAFKRLDESVLKPALIFSYNKSSYKRSRSIYHKFEDEAEKMEEQFTKQREGDY